MILPPPPAKKRKRTWLGCACDLPFRLNGYQGLGYVCTSAPSTPQEWVNYIPVYHFYGNMHWDDCTGMNEYQINDQKQMAQAQIIAGLNRPPPPPSDNHSINIAQDQKPVQNQGSTQDTGIGNKTTSTDPNASTISLLDTFTKLLSQAQPAQAAPSYSAAPGASVSVQAGGSSGGASDPFAQVLDKDKFYILGGIALVFVGVYFLKNKKAGRK